MSEKKVGDRRVTVESIACIVLITAIVAIIAFYNSLLKYKDATIASLNSEIEDKDAQISSLIYDKNDLQSQVGNLTEIIELNKSEVWIDDYFVNVAAGSYVSFNRTADYAGYLKFEDISSVPTTETGEIYAQVMWSGKDHVFYKQKLVVGEDEFFRFPVLPTSNLEVRIGYDDPSNGTADIRVTIVYVY